MTKLEKRGIYGIHCFCTNKTFCTCSVNGRDERQKDVEQLRAGTFVTP